MVNSGNSIYQNVCFRPGADVDSGRNLSFAIEEQCFIKLLQLDRAYQVNSNARKQTLVGLPPWLHFRLPPSLLLLGHADIFSNKMLDEFCNRIETEISRPGFKTPLAFFNN